MTRDQDGNESGVRRVSRDWSREKTKEATVVVLKCTVNLSNRTLKVLDRLKTTA